LTGATGLSDQPPRRVGHHQAHYRHRSTGRRSGHDRGDRATWTSGPAPPDGHRRDPEHRPAALPRHWRTLLAIAAVVVVPFTLLQYLVGDLVRTEGETTRNGIVETASWSVGIAGLVAALAGILMYLVLTGAITRAVAAEVAGQDPSVEQSYRFGFHRLGPVLLVSVLVGLAIVGGLILFIIPGIYIGIRLCVSIEALVVEGRRGTEAMGRSWGLVGGHWWHAFGTLVVAGLLTGIVNAVITAPFGNTGWFVQGVVAAVATVVTMPYGVLVGVLLYLDLRARKEALTLETLRTDLQASAA
jgi:hypothetical protein